jgi:hypothetical protein
MVSPHSLASSQPAPLHPATIELAVSGSSSSSTDFPFALVFAKVYPISLIKTTAVVKIITATSSPQEYHLVAEDANPSKMPQKGCWFTLTLFRFRRHPVFPDPFCQI